MKKRCIKLTLSLLCFFTMLFAVSGNISAETRSKNSLLQVKTVSAKEIHGSFTQDGRTIYFETRKGSPNPDDDPDAPLFELDVRIMDGNHIPFIVQIAGHRPMEEKWYEEQKSSENMPVHGEERAVDFSMLPGMIKALKAYNKKHKKIQWEIKEVIKLLVSVVNKDISDETKNLSIENQTQEEISIASSSYAHEVAIRRKRAFGVVFEHSAIRLRIYQAGLNLISQYSTCNHGTCSTDSSMSTKCTRTFVKSDVMFYLWDLMCDYWGYPYGSHLCNGDTYQEYLSIKNSQSIDWGVCGTARFYAPNCD